MPHSLALIPWHVFQTLHCDKKNKNKNEVKNMKKNEEKKEEKKEERI